MYVHIPINAHLCDLNVYLFLQPEPSIAGIRCGDAPLLMAYACGLCLCLRSLWRNHSAPVACASVNNDDHTATGKESVHKTPSEQPRWRSTMYGIEEDDLEFLQDSQAPVVEEEEGFRVAEVSNPWTITRMNAAIQPKQPIGNGQLLTLAKS
jgi:hypothetical protein